MDYSIESVCRDLSGHSSGISHLDHEVLIVELTDKDIIRGSLSGRSCSRGFNSFVMRANFAAVLLCRSGRVKLKLDLKEYTLEKNQILIIIPGVICGGIEVCEPCGLTLLAYNNPQHLREPNSDIAMIPRRYLYKRPVLQLSEKQKNEFMSICDIMRERIEQSEYTFKREVVYVLIEVLYIDMSNLMKREMEQIDAGINDRNKKLYDSFMDLLFKYAGVEREVSFYADILCITPKYLSRIVKNVSGRFAKDWIRDYVILQAKTLLDSGRYTIQQVSDKLNFPNQSFFGTYFKTTVGCSPKAYMER